MYSVSGFGQMIADEIRMAAYAQALQQTVRPGSVVIDIGAGTGILSLLACRYGARKVYAIEPGNAIHLAREAARANDCADRIDLLQALSTEVELPEKADVIVSDLHGVMPLFAQSIPAIVDARKRWMARQGKLIPQRETLWVAVVSANQPHARLVDPWGHNRHELDLSSTLPLVTNTWSKLRVETNQLLTAPHCWAALDYRTIESANVNAAVTLPVHRPGVAHGLLIWFDSQLTDGIEFSNAPGKPEMIYGSGYFPWPEAVPLNEGDQVILNLRADLTGADYTWSWHSQIISGGKRTKHFRQSTFFSEPLSAEALRRRASSHRPLPSQAAALDQVILSMMDGTHTLGEMADRLMELFPGKFTAHKDALTRVANFTEKYPVNESDSALQTRAANV